MKLPLFKKHEITLTALAIAIWLLRWPLVQLVAWVGMVVHYSLDHGIQRGLQMTFSGEHPCLLCGMVQAGVEKDVAILNSPLGFSVLALALVSIAVASLISRHFIRRFENEH